jgi:TPP-dependent pyruvate/acetoin dehydrogenase alpha subunit
VNAFLENELPFSQENNQAFQQFSLLKQSSHRQHATLTVVAMRRCLLRNPHMSQLAEKNVGTESAPLLAIYRQMARIRAVDKGIQAGLSAGKFLFAYWPCTGQEVIPATIAQLTSKRDYMVTTYRGIHDQVAKGLDLEKLFAEALARIDGVNKGKGGAPHISDPASGSMLTTAIVGAGAPIANGLAFAAKTRAAAVASFERMTPTSTLMAHRV